MRSLLRSAYAGWMVVARKIGWFNSRVILTVVFYLVLTPVGLVRRILGYDPMHRRFELETGSYRVTRAPRPGSHMEKPY
jgi:hypothetical protein